MSISYPLVNGVRYSFSSIKLTFNGKQVVGFKEISYKQTKEPSAVRGAHPQKLGRTQGELEEESSLTVYEEEWNELLDILGDGYMDAVFDITVTYATNELVTRVVTDKIFGAQIKGIDKSRSQGPDGLEVKLDLDVMEIHLDGKKPLKNPLVQLRLS